VIDFGILGKRIYSQVKGFWAASRWRAALAFILISCVSSNASAILCIQNGDLPEDGAVDCKPSKIVSDLYYGPIGLTFTNPVCDEHQDDPVATEACLKDFMSTFRSCFIEHVQTADWQVQGSWGDNGMHPEGEKTLRRWEKSFISNFGTHRTHDNGLPYCDNTQVFTQAWGMGDQRTALCRPGLGLYDWYPSGSTEATMVCADPQQLQCPRFGNPIDVASGTKIYTDVHVRMDDAGILDLSWHYNSARQSYVQPAGISLPVTTHPVIGFEDKVWRHRFDSTLMYAKGGTRPVVRIARPDSEAYFIKSAGKWISSGYTYKGILIERPASRQERWEYHSDTDTVEVYDATGKVTRITESNGRSVSLIYSKSKLARVEASPERFIRFEYEANDGRLSAVVTSAGDRYAYDVNPISGVLRSVTFPGSAKREYKYNGPYEHLLTGVTDELNKRVATYQYDLSQRPSSTQRAGGVDHYDVVYADWLYGKRITVTDPLHASAELMRRQVGPLSILGRPAVQVLDGLSAPLAGAESWWQHSENDTNGNITMRQNFDGSVERARFDLSRNLETFHAGDADTASQQDRNTLWHPDWHKPVQRAEPGMITTWMHNGQTVNGDAISCAPASARHGGKPLPAVCWMVEQPTADSTGAQGFDAAAQGKARVQRFTYNATGQMLLAEQYNEVAPALALHPNMLPDTTVPDARLTLTYAKSTDASLAMGDPASLKLEYPSQTPPPEPAVTTFKRYNARGQVLEATLPQGSTNLRYHRRGWITEHRFTPNGASSAQVTKYVHDDAGQLKQATLPDGAVLHFKYDDAHRMREVWDSVGNRVVYDVNDANVVTARTDVGAVTDLDQRFAEAIDPQSAAVAAGSAVVERSWISRDWIAPPMRHGSDPRSASILNGGGGVSLLIDAAAPLGPIKPLPPWLLPIVAAGFVGWEIGNLINPYVQPGIGVAIDWCMSRSKQQCEDDCYAAYEKTIDLVCKKLSSPKGRAQCYSNANIVHGQCRAGCK
jgi:YD repeat-containing protein